MQIGGYPKVYFELMIIGFSLIMGMGFSSSFLPIFADELDPSGVLVGFAVSAYFFFRIFTELPSGILCDRLGRQKLLVAGLLISAVGTFVCSVADTIYLLIAGRALWGLGTALFFMSATALLLDLFDSNMRGRALGTYQGVEFIGSFIGAPVGGFIAESIGYKRVFLLAFIVILFSFFVAFSSKGLRQARSKIDREEELSMRSVLHSLGSCSLAVICVNSFSRMFIMYGITSTVFPLYVNRQLSVGVELIGIIISIRTVGHIIATVTSGYLSDRFGRKPVILTGMLTQTGCLYLYTLVSPFELLSLISFFDGLGAGMTFTSLIVLLSETTPAHLRGSAIGMYRTFMDIGGFIGPPTFMLLFDGMGAQVAFISAAVILAVNIVLLASVKSKKAIE